MDGSSLVLSVDSDIIPTMKPTMNRRSMLKAAASGAARRIDEQAHAQDGRPDQAIRVPLVLRQDEPGRSVQERRAHRDSKASIC